MLGNAANLLGRGAALFLLLLVAALSIASLVVGGLLILSHEELRRHVAALVLKRVRDVS